MRKPLILTLFAAAFYVFSHTQLPALESQAMEKPAGIHVTPLRVVSVSHRDDKATLSRENFDTVVQSLYDRIGLKDKKLGFDIFRKAMVGYYTLEKEGALNDNHLLTIINFEQPSTEKRFYTIDLENAVLKYHTYVAHGRNTGENMAVNFSNTPHSNQSSLGFFVTAETYYGSKGYSLRLDGKEKLFNDKVRSRAVVIHAADYVTEKWIKRYGRLGRSQGCPALPPHLNKEVIDVIKGGTAIFTYFPEENYLNKSTYLQDEQLFKLLDKKPIDLVGVKQLTKGAIDS